MRRTFCDSSAGYIPIELVAKGGLRGELGRGMEWRPGIGNVHSFFSSSYISSCIHLHEAATVKAPTNKVIRHTVIYLVKSSLSLLATDGWIKKRRKAAQNRSVPGRYVHLNEH